MSWAGKTHPVELIVEWTSPIPLAMAASWASVRLGLPLTLAAAIGGVALMAGHIAFRLAGDRAAALRGFEPAEFESVEPDELLLEEKDSVLELEDRLEDVQPDSRVVRLFAREEPTPGELVDRIVGFLADGRRGAPSNPPPPEAVRPDASAALHEALANIRASLR